MKSLFTILLLTFVTPAIGEHVQIVQDGITIDVTLEPTSFTVGDPVSLQIVATTLEDKKIELLQTNSFGSFVINDESHLLDIPNGLSREWTWSMQLDSFDANTDLLSGISIGWSDLNGSTGVIYVDPIPVEVQSVAGVALQEMELRDIKSSVPLFSKSWWPLSIVAVLFICAIGVVIFFLKKKREPMLPPHVQAILAIQSLQKSDTDVVTFYTSLSNIVRTYIEEQFQIATTGQTTREFLIEEKENPRFEHQDRKALADFLVAADLVKFARFEPSESIWNEATDRALEFVTHTVQTQTQVEVAA